MENTLVSAGFYGASAYYTVAVSDGISGDVL